MRFSKAEIQGVWEIDPEYHSDQRGHFFRAWCLREFSDQGINFVPVQSNVGYSFRRGTLRGMHYQVEPALEAKLVRCTRGRIFDVALDVRRESLTFGKWFGTELTAENGRMLLIPEGCAHGYQTLEENTEIYYMASQFYCPEAVRGVRFDDLAFGIQWPLIPSVISMQDSNWPLTGETGRLSD